LGEYTPARALERVIIREVGVIQPREDTAWLSMAASKPARAAGGERRTGGRREDLMGLADKHCRVEKETGDIEERAPRGINRTDTAGWERGTEKWRGVWKPPISRTDENDKEKLEKQVVICTD
jgi:hypothetical protein